ncbi:MAG: glycerophosphodiester phosphodiesterase [bacterium]
MVQIIAHRGSSRLHPENTAAAFAHAVESGANLLEVDIRRSCDGVLYCFHDNQLQRLTGCAGTIEQTASNELDSLQVNGAEPLLRLEEFLRLFGDRAGIVLDIKSARIEESLLQALDNGSPAREVIFSSFSAEVLRRLAELRQGLRLALIIGPWRNLGWHLKVSDSMIARLRELGCSAAHIHHRLARPEAIKAFHAAGLAVSVWTVDDPATAARLAGIGADGIISNTPESLQQRRF